MLAWTYPRQQASLTSDEEEIKLRDLFDAARNGNTDVLIGATWKGQIEVVRVLLAAGADPTVGGRRQRW